MSGAITVSGVALSSQLRHDVGNRAENLRKMGIVPGLAVILVGDDPASAVYVRNKVKACEQHGMRSTLEQLPAATTESQLLERVAQLNSDSAVHGILVQLPLPGHIDKHKVIEAISAEKDVDGFNVANAGALLTGRPKFKPCTPYGVMKMLEASNVAIEGRHAVVVGASNIVGKPMAVLLLEAGATVTVCHHKTVDLAVHTRQADILVVAVGKPNLITGSMVKPGAVVIDVGINKGVDGKICGDVNFSEVSEVAGYISPVPGGVGPMTITMLLVNTLESAEAFAEKAAMKEAA